MISGRIIIARTTIVVLNSVLLCSCCPTAQLGSYVEIPRDTPKQLFITYVEAASNKDYRTLVECLVPSHQYEYATTLLKKKEFDNKAARYTAMLQAQFGNDRVKDFQETMVDQIDAIYFNICHWPCPYIDFTKAQYIERDGAVWAICQDVSFYLAAVKYKGKWYLSDPNYRHISGEMAMAGAYFDHGKTLLDRRIAEMTHEIEETPDATTEAK